MPATISPTSVTLIPSGISILLVSVAMVVDSGTDALDGVPIAGNQHHNQEQNKSRSERIGTHSVMPIFSYP